MVTRHVAPKQSDTVRTKKALCVSHATSPLRHGSQVGSSGISTGKLAAASPQGKKEGLSTSLNNNVTDRWDAAGTRGGANGADAVANACPPCPTRPPPLSPPEQQAQAERENENDEVDVSEYEELFASSDLQAREDKDLLTGDVRPQSMISPNNISPDVVVAKPSRPQSMTVGPARTRSRLSLGSSRGFEDDAAKTAVKVGELWCHKRRVMILLIFRTQPF